MDKVLHKDRLIKLFQALILAVVIFEFFSALWPIIFATHDDICSYMYVRLHQIFQNGLAEAKRQGRFYFIYTTFAYSLPYIGNSYIWFKFISYLSLLFSAGSLGYFFCTVKKNLAGVAVLLFFAFAQIDGQHNVFISYIFHHQITMGFLLLSLSMLFKYFQYHKKVYMIISAVLYAIPLFFYEAFLFFSPLYFFLSWWFCHKGNNGTFKNQLKTAISCIKYHIALCILFLICYFVFQHFYPANYDGATPVLNDVPNMIRTILTLGTGLFPGRAFQKIFTLSNLPHALMTAPIHQWIIAAGCGVSVLLFMKKEMAISLKQTMQFILFGIAGIFLPCIPYAATSKYVVWVTEGRIYGFVPSFFSYFFIIIVLVLLIHLGYHVVPWKRIYQIVIFFLVTFLTLITLFNNSNVESLITAPLERYRSFDTIVSSPPVTDLTEESTIYIPDYTGIHNTMYRSEKYLKIYTDANIHLINDKEQLAFELPVYEVRYFNELGVTAFGKIDKDFCASQLYLISNDGALSEKINIKSEEIDAVVTTNGKKDILLDEVFINMENLQIVEIP